MPECFDARKSRVAEAFTRLDVRAVGEFSGGDLFASFEFDGLEPQKSCVAAADEPVVLGANESAGR